jgi:hypothetical protein
MYPDYGTDDPRAGDWEEKTDTCLAIPCDECGETLTPEERHISGNDRLECNDCWCARMRVEGRLK